MAIGKKMKRLILMSLFAMTSVSLLYGADNEIFIDQSGATSNLDIEQVGGSGNIIGGSDAAAGSMTALDIDEIKESSLAQGNLAKSASWFLGFLKRNQHWVTKYDHNHLRITRVIKSLRLLTSDKAADEFKDKVFGYLGDEVNLIDPKARSFWNSV